MIRIKKGLDIPLSGAPKQAIDTVKEVFRVAVTGADFNGMKPTMKVQEGDTVKTGQLLFECKKVKGVRYTSPASGKVVSINRGAKRVFETLVIEVHGDEYVDFENYKSNSNLDKLSDENVRALLVESGLWTTLRTRPFSKSASLTQKPHSIFITAMDTNPHAPDPKLIIAENDEAFSDGVKILSKLSEKDSLYETIIVATNDEFVKQFLDKKIKFIDLMNKIYKFVNLDEFKKYKYIKPHKIENIEKLNQYVRFKINNMSI